MFASKLRFRCLGRRSPFPVRLSQRSYIISAEQGGDSSHKHYDLVVVGAGAGAKVSTPASKLGFKVAMCEHGFDVFGEHKPGLGGTCLNRGCIPSKMLIHAADVAHEIQHEAKKFHLTLNHPASSPAFSVDLASLVSRVERSVDKDSESIIPGYQNDPNRDLYLGSARFVGDRMLQVGKRTISADHVVLAAGCVPKIPTIPGLSETPYLTSTEALRLKQQPKRLVVIGAGYIAVELAHYFGGLGTEVHVMARSSLLRHVDTESRHEFARLFKQSYHVHENINFHQISYDNNEFSVSYREQDGEVKRISCDQLLVAAGIQPVSQGLCLDAAGVEVRPDGFVRVDGRLRTSAPNVFAMGDIAGNYAFRHSANYEGEYLLSHVIHPLHQQRLAHPAPAPSLRSSPAPALSPAQWSQGALFSHPNSALQSPIHYGHVPWAVFSCPQVAGVGHSEDDLQRQGISYVKGVCPYRKSAMGDAILPDGGFVKLLIARDGSRKILGCVIVGREASVLIHQIIPLMRLNAKLDDLLHMIYIHPALNEIVRNAARNAKQALIDAGESLPIELAVR